MPCHAHRTPIPRPPRLSSSPSERLQAAMQTDEKRGPSASQCASLANSIQPAWRQDTHAASLLAARLRAGPLSCVACFQVPRGGPRMGFRFGIACATRVRPCLSLQYVKGSVRWRSEGGTYVVGLGGRLVGGLGFFLWDCTVHTHTSLWFASIPGNHRGLQTACSSSLLSAYKPHHSSPSSQSLTTIERSQSQTKQTPPLLHRHSTSPHLPPPTTTTTMPRSYIADNSASRP